MICHWKVDNEITANPKRQAFLVTTMPKAPPWKFFLINDMADTLLFEDLLFFMPVMATNMSVCNAWLMKTRLRCSAALENITPELSLLYCLVWKRFLRAINWLFRFTSVTNNKVMTYPTAKRWTMKWSASSRQNLFKKWSHYKDAQYFYLLLTILNSNISSCDKSWKQ